MGLRQNRATTLELLKMTSQFYRIGATFASRFLTDNWVLLTEY